MRILVEGDYFGPGHNELSIDLAYGRDFVVMPASVQASADAAVQRVLEVILNV